MIFSLLFIMFLLILCNFITYCFDLIAYCSLVLFMTNSTFNPTCVGNGSVNVCIYVKWFCGICMGWQEYYTIFPNWIVGVHEIYLWAPTEMLGHWSCNKTEFCELVLSWGECTSRPPCLFCSVDVWTLSMTELVCRKSHIAITWYQGGVWSAARIIGAIFLIEILSHTAMLHCDAVSKTSKIICAFFMWMVQQLLLQTVMLV
jgi:hypothetical protein